jgi:hypothetical protein
MEATHPHGKATHFFGYWWDDAKELLSASIAMEEAARLQARRQGIVQARFPFR